MDFVFAPGNPKLLYRFMGPELSAAPVDAVGICELLIVEAAALAAGAELSAPVRPFNLAWFAGPDVEAVADVPGVPEAMFSSVWLIEIS